MKKLIKKEKFTRRFSLKFITLALIVVIGVIFSAYWLFKELPSPSRLNNPHTPQSILIYDRNDTLLYNLHKDKDQTFVPLSTIPKNVQNATIAIEDRNFYNHGAIDIKGIMRALYSIVFHKELQGGSTLTQQLVKNSLLTQERTISRKVKEIILAYGTELIYSKNKILEMYLNQTPYGGTAWGIEAASQTYFGKAAKDLNLAEAALLAGLPEAPTAYSPFGSHPELAKERQRQVLNSMYEEGYITKKQMDEAYNEKLNYKNISNNIKAPHFVLYIKDYLVKKYGDKVLEEGGLKVKTTLDLPTQEFVQDAVATEVAKLKGYRVTNGAAMVTDPGTGEILAMVGSRGYFDPDIDGNVNVTLSHRQPGSSIKPINYAVGLLNGYTAATPFVDQKTCFPSTQSKPYCPVNYDGKWHGVVQMRYALGNSFNIPAVKMLKANGIESMISTASAMGITTFEDPSRYGLSLTLGGGEVMMIDMAQAFGVFANGGYKVELQPILKITDRFENVVEEYKPPKSPIFGKKILPNGVAFIISDILSDNGARLQAFGASSELVIPGQKVSVKTGTTNDYRDNWTIGYTPSYVVATWVGNNDNTPMNGLASGITGAAPIWNTIMSHLLENKDPEPMEIPSDVVQRAVCSTTGVYPNSKEGGGCPTRYEYFVRGTEPKGIKISTEEVWVDKDTQQIPEEGKTDNLELKKQTFITDPSGSRYCITCPNPTEEPTPTP